MNRLLILVVFCIGLFSQYEIPITFNSGNIKLEGWLTKPHGNGPFPAIVLVHGSGDGPAQNPVFRTHAKKFNSIGYAVFFYNKRGVGNSEGDHNFSTFNNLADDVISAVNAIGKRSDIMESQIGLWGISQGGWIGPLAASKSDKIKFVISASGPAVSPYEQAMYLEQNRFRDRGLNKNQVIDATILFGAIIRYYSDPDELSRREAQIIWDQFKNETWLSKAQIQELQGLKDSVFTVKTATILAERIGAIHHHRNNTFYNPIPAFYKMKQSFLGIYGGKDRIVNAKRTIAKIEELYKDERSNYTLQFHPEGNHHIRYYWGDNGKPFLDGYVDGYFEQMLNWVKSLNKN